MTPNFRVLVLAAAAVVAAGAAPALAQTTDSAGPSGGLFGGGSSNANAQHTLDLTMSLSAAYDSDVWEEAPTIVNQLLRPLPTAHSNMLVGAAEYGWRGRHVQVRASGGSTARHHRLSGDFRSLNHWALAGFTARLPRRTTLLVNQTATYAPSFLYTLFPPASAAGAGELPIAAPNSPASDFESYAFGTQMTLMHSLTRRSRLSAVAERNQTDYRGATTGQAELDWHGVTGLAAYAVGRNTTATGRYRYRSGNFATGSGITTAGLSTEQGVEIGVSHSLPFSRTRRLTLDVGFGSSVVIPPEPPEGESPRGRSHPLVGQLGMAYLFAQSWQASATYLRKVDYVPGLTAPASTDGFTARLDGLIARRIDALASANYSSGRSALNRDTPRFDTYSANARLRYALARTVAVHVEYVYYFYDFRGNTELAPGMPDTLERHGVRAGVMLRVPALGR